MIVPNPPAPEPPVNDTLRELLKDHDVRGRLVGILAEEIETRREPSPWLRRQPRQVIQRYVALGRAFVPEERYGLAEVNFAKAFELSENRRLDSEQGARRNQRSRRVPGT